jgi:hypothetical protein
MLVFVIPLKSPLASSNWEKVSQLFEITLKSVCNQTSDKFQVIVVCHQKPTISYSHPSVTYLEVDFPISANPDIRTKRRDRVRKVLTGMVYARRFKPSYVMKVDADDCISQRLAEFVDQNPQCNGWLVNQGYEYQEGSKFIYLRKSNFYRHCGTSTIIKFDLLDLPLNPESMDYEELVQYHLPHSKTDKNISKKGNTLDCLPFIGAVYIIKNGENTYPREKKLPEVIKNPSETVLYLKDIYRNFSSQVLTQSIGEEFGLEKIPALKIAG